MNRKKWLKMNKFEKNQAEELINSLFDKDVSSVEKSRILEQLSQYPEYKSDLELYTEINNHIQASKTIIEPPDELTKSLFAKINTIASKHFSNTLLNRSKYLIGAFLLIFLFTSYYFFNTNKATNGQLTNKIANTKSELNVSNHTDNEINIQKQNSNNSVNSYLLNNPDFNNGIVKQNTYSQKNNKSASNDEHNKIIVNSQNNNLKTINDLNDASYINNPIPTNYNQMNPTENHTQLNATPDYLAYNIENSNYHINRVKIIPKQNKDINLFTFANFHSEREPVLLIQYRSLYAVSNPEKSLQGNALSSNYCVGIFLKTYENLYFGAEFGNETFSQIYLDPNTQIKYEQSPSVFYFGVGGKYNAKDLNIIGIYPSAQVFVGSSSLGPILRTNLSFQYDIINNLLGIYGGIEGSAVFYSNQSVWYSSKKLGLIGGVNIKF